MARAGRIVHDTLALMREIVRPGLTTEDLDREAEAFIRSHPGATSVVQGAVRLSEDALHVDRRGDRARHPVDQARALRGLDRLGGCWCMRRRPARRLGHDDSRRVNCAGGAAPARRHRSSRFTPALPRHSPAITSATSATRCSAVAEAAGFGVVRELVGHGIGTRFHEEPQIPNFGTPHRGPQLKPGMTLAIEPMITMGKPGDAHAQGQVDRGDAGRVALGPLRAYRLS